MPARPGKQFLNGLRGQQTQARYPSENGGFLRSATGDMRSGFSDRADRFQNAPAPLVFDAVEPHLL